MPSRYPVLVGGVLFFRRLSPNWLAWNLELPTPDTIAREEGKTSILHLCLALRLLRRITETTRALIPCPPPWRENIPLSARSPGRPSAAWKTRTFRRHEPIFRGTKGVREAALVDERKLGLRVFDSSRVNGDCRERKHDSHSFSRELLVRGEDTLQIFVSPTDDEEMC